MKRELEEFRFNPERFKLDVFVIVNGNIEKIPYWRYVESFWDKLITRDGLRAPYHLRKDEDWLRRDLYVHLPKMKTEFVRSYATEADAIFELNLINEGRMMEVTDGQNSFYLSYADACQALTDIHQREIL